MVSCPSPRVDVYGCCPDLRQTKRPDPAVFRYAAPPEGGRLLPRLRTYLDLLAASRAAAEAGLIATPVAKAVPAATAQFQLRRLRDAAQGLLARRVDQGDREAGRCKHAKYC